MDTAQFKEIIGLIQSSGSFAAPLLWVWILLSYLTTPTAVAIIFTILFRLARYAISILSVEDDIKKLRDILECGHGDMSDTERKCTVKILTHIAQQYMESKKTEKSHE